MQTAKKNRHFTRKSVIIILSVLLILAIGAFIKAHDLNLGWTKNHTEQQLVAFEKKLETMYQDIQETLHMQTSGNTMTSVNQVKDAYLLTKMAAAALQNNQDIDLARQLLQLASDHLSELKGPQIDAAKKVLEADQQQLNSLHLPDMHKVQERLNMLDKLISVMPIAGVYEAPVKTPTTDAPVNAKHSWRQVMTAILNDLKNAVKIRKKSDREINVNDIDIARAQFKLIIEQLRCNCANVETSF